jgi:hypothetical protein
MRTKEPRVRPDRIQQPTRNDGWFIASERRTPDGELVASAGIRARWLAEMQRDVRLHASPALSAGLWSGG